MIQQEVVAAFQEEMVRSKQPNYICRYDDYGEENYARLKESEATPDILPMSAHQPAVEEETTQRRVDAPHGESLEPHVEKQNPQPEIRFQSESDSFGAGVM